MQFLGNSIEKIAYEKAGIIKEGIPVVIGESQLESDVVLKVWQIKTFKFDFADKQIVSNYPSDLKGPTRR